VIHSRVIPYLLLKDKGLVKTVKFKTPKYLGDPRNVVKIFNEKEVDELIILDILATPEKRSIQFDLIQEIVSEAFMPVAYGGGIRNIDDARKVLALGVEKIVINTYAIENPSFIREVADLLGSQSVVVCMDVKKNFVGKYKVFTHGGRKAFVLDPATVAKQMEKAGAGELVVNSIERDGTMMGYDLELIRSVVNSVNIPVIACGGAGRVDDFRDAIKKGGASAVAAGSFFVFEGRHRAVLISYPEQAELKRVLS
jgi:imidazole glycerol-phosphate synthase subunit HisF